MKSQLLINMIDDPDSIVLIRTFTTRDGIHKDMLEVRNLSKKFGGQEALKEVNLTFNRGEFFSLLGPSGCGKTTLLRILGGFESFSSGELKWGSDCLKLVPPEKRPFNMVFQKYALFPHLNVWNNIAFGLQIKKLPAQDIKQRVSEALELVRMEDFAFRRIQTLSGGQQQRIALARALANRPEVLLLDESLSALDLQLRKQMQIELHELQRKLKITFIFVTHDQEEAMTLSDRIAVMRNGVVEQVGTPEEIYETPATSFVASFIGTINQLPAEFIGQESPGVAQIKIASGQVLQGRSIRPIEDTNSVLLLLRPERLRLRSRSAGVKPGCISLAGKIKEIFFKGDTIEVIVDPQNENLPDICVSLARTSIHAMDSLPPLQRDQSVHVWWNVEDSIVMAAN